MTCTSSMVDRRIGFISSAVDTIIIVRLDTFFLLGILKVIVRSTGVGVPQTVFLAQSLGGSTPNPVADWSHHENRTLTMAVPTGAAGATDPKIGPGILIRTLKKGDEARLLKTGNTILVRKKRMIRGFSILVAVSCFSEFNQSKFNCIISSRFLLTFLTNLGPLRRIPGRWDEI
jgi:hypothetical protein